MSQDVSVKSIDLMKGYNSRVKTFNTSVNTLIYAFRNQIENIINEQKERLRKINGDFESACNQVDGKIRQIDDLLSRFNWHPEAEAKIQNELMRLQEIRMNLEMKMSAIEARDSNISLPLDQVLQSAATFGLSNQNLLDSNVRRMEGIIQYIDTYKNSNV